MPEKFLTPDEYKKLRSTHERCKPGNLARQSQTKAAKATEGRCHMPGTQCRHIWEYSCMECGFGYAVEQAFVRPTGP